MIPFSENIYGLSEFFYVKRQYDSNSQDGKFSKKNNKNYESIKNSRSQKADNTQVPY
jgi:hypothetical protein